MSAAWDHKPRASINTTTHLPQGCSDDWQKQSTYHHTPATGLLRRLTETIHVPPHTCHRAAQTIDRDNPRTITHLPQGCSDDWQRQSTWRTEHAAWHTVSCLLAISIFCDILCFLWRPLHNGPVIQLPLTEAFSSLESWLPSYLLNVKTTWLGNLKRFCWPQNIIHATLVQFSSVAQSCPTLCDPMNRSTPGLPVHHQLLESWSETNCGSERDFHMDFILSIIWVMSYMLSPSNPVNLSQVLSSGSLLSSHC